MQKVKKRTPDMLEGPLLKNIILYAIPVMLTTLLQLAFNAADLMIVGQYCEDVAIAGVGNTGSIIALIVNFFMGLSVGAGVTVAQALGANDKDAIHNAVHTSVPVAIICGLIITAVGLIFSENFLAMIDTPKEVLPYSIKYMKIYFLGTVFIMLYNFCAAILRAAGDTKSPLVFLAIAGVINVGLNILFIKQFNMDADGVAWATTISQGVSAILVVIALMRRKDACKLKLSKLRIYWVPFIKLFKIGMPAGIQSCLFAIGNVVIQGAINSFGSTFMSACSASTNIEGFMSCIVAAMHQAALNFTGQNVGANNYKRVKQVFIRCLLCVFVGCILLAAVIYSVSPYWLKIYLPDSPEAIEIGVEKIAIICSSYFICGLMDVSTGGLRGMGISFLPMIISILGVCGSRILWVNTIFQIPRFHTHQCLFLVYAVSWGITFIAQTTLWIIAYRKRSRLQHI